MSAERDVAVGQATPGRPPTTLWRNRDFLLLWGGQLVSLIGTGASQLAFPLLVLALTASPAQAGLLAALRAVPYVTLALPAGALVDQWNRKRVMLVCEASRALLLFSIPVALALNHFSLAQLYVVGVLEGVGFTFYSIAEKAALPNVVAREQVTDAAALNEASANVTFLLSPPLGGVLYGIFAGLPFLADALSYALSAGSLLLIRARFQGDRAADGAQRQRCGFLWNEIVEGLRWLWRDRLIRHLALLAGGINAALLSGELLLVVVALAQGAPPAAIGLLFAVGGIGSVLGAILSAPLRRRMPFGILLLGACTVLAVLYPLLALAASGLALAAVFAAISFVGPVFNVAQYSYRMGAIPDALQGRVNSVFGILAFGIQPLGVTTTGLLVQWSGVPTTVAALALFLALLALATALNPVVRHAR